MHADALIVDDYPDTLVILEVAFRMFGLVAHTVSSGQDALLYLRFRPPPYVVFLDFMMPEMTGDVVLERIRQVYPEDALAIYMVSGLHGLEKKAGCPVMLKPVTARRLANITRYHRDQSRRLKRSRRPDDLCAATFG